MERKLPILPFLETMITQVCNLSCQGCTNYSDLKHSGYVPWKQGQEILGSWLEKIDIPDFGIMGGEPMINPEWREWIIGIRNLMPTSQIRFTTNGSLLSEIDDILDIMDLVGNIVFKITVHTQSTDLETKISSILENRKWEIVIEHGIKRYQSDNGVRLQINRPQKFLKTFKGPYSTMSPYHSDPRKSFEICCQKTCPLLYDRKIYKCSTAGLLKNILERFGNPNFLEWKPYLHNGIGINDSDDDIARFIENFGTWSQICGQCPSDPNQMIDHASTVVFKNKSLNDI